jgi:hypothetical protein
MSELNYKFLGQIPVEVLDEIKQEILSRVAEAPTAYRIVSIDLNIVKRFHALLFPESFNTSNISVNHSKVFISPPGTGCRFIHKDGIDKRCALNVIVECNPEDWVRWYSDSEIERRGGKIIQPAHTVIASRDITNISTPTEIPFIQQVTAQRPGDMYLINTDVFHFFRNQGSNYRLLIQTKFSPNPSIEEVDQRIQQVGLKF